MGLTVEICMWVVGYSDLKNAVNSLNPIQKHEVWLVLSINGMRYYPFKSKQTLDQHLITQASRRALVNMELERRPYFRSERIQRADRLFKFFKQSAEENEVTVEDGHAEEFMIKYWPDCVSDYQEYVGGKIKSVEIFIAHSPCTDYDKSPSRSRKLGDSFVYPTSCSSKLKLFFNKGFRVGINLSAIDFNRLKWKIYYQSKFAALANKGEDAFRKHFSSMPIENMHYDAHLFFNQSIERSKRAVLTYQDDQMKNKTSDELTLNS